MIETCDKIMDSNIDFSVLFSVYYKENAAFFDRALESIYNQTVKAKEWVIVKDGAIGQELQDVIDKYKKIQTIREIQLEENKGLCNALRIGVTECSHELIARMDTDDIALPDRFEKQLTAFNNDSDLDLCGGQILEFETDENQIIAERKVPLAEDKIRLYQKKRTAFNHMTVMFKKSKVLEAGNYKNFPLMEDGVLWVDMLNSGVKCLNLDDYICKVRTNRDMIARRGGLAYYKKYKAARKYILSTGFITRGEYLKNNFIQFLVCIMPAWLRKIVFFKMLHKKKKEKSK